jgi:hypothetical protein
VRHLAGHQQHKPQRRVGRMIAEADVARAAPLAAVRAQVGVHSRPQRVQRALRRAERHGDLRARACESPVLSISVLVHKVLCF